MKYVAQLSHVNEISLLGTADLAYWKQRLEPENLGPAERDGKAQVLIIAAAAKFRGLRFRELSFSILVDPPQGTAGRDAAYLLGAFNSNAFFAFCERTFFSTPYQAGDVRVSTSPLAAITLRRDGQERFRAEMLPASPRAGREPASHAEDAWEGPVFLPRRPGARDRTGKLFFARVSGKTERFPFLPLHDSLSIFVPPHGGALLSLIDSGFAATEWLVRGAATHSKSKTVKR